MNKTQARAALAALAAQTAIQAVINEFDTLGEAEHYVPLQQRPQAALERALANHDAYADTDYEAGDRERKAAAIKALGGHRAWYDAVATAIGHLSVGTVASIGYSRVSKAEWAREGARVDYARAEVLAWEIHATDEAVVAEAEAQVVEPLGRLDAQLVGATYSGTDTPVAVAPRYVPAPTNVDANAVLTSTFGEEYRALWVGDRSALIADLLDLHQAERHATIEKSAHTLAGRIRPASLQSYADTLRAGQRRRAGR